MSALLLAAGHPLVHLNAALNALATVLLVVGLWQIKHGREGAHGRTMLAAFAVSCAFLVSYLTYHRMAGHVVFTQPGAVGYVYRVVLWTHIPLAFMVPFLAMRAIWLGARAVGWLGSAVGDESLRLAARRRHLRLVRWAYPIWIYVSVTGVVIYAMLYHLWPPDGL